MDQKQSHLDKDSTHKEMETNSSLVSKTLKCMEKAQPPGHYWEDQCSEKTQPPGHQLDQLKPKTSPKPKTTKEEEQLLMLPDKYQTGEVETPTKLELQLIPWIMDLDQRLLDLVKDLIHKETTMYTLLDSELIYSFKLI